MRRSTSRLPARVRLLSQSRSPPRFRAPERWLRFRRLSSPFPREALEARWRADHLERLARSYWRFLARISLGFLRVVYAADSRTVVLLVPALRLLTFRPPEYVTEPTFGQVTWRIRRGLLVAREGVDNGFLQIRIWREGATPPRLRMSSSA